MTRCPTSPRPVEQHTAPLRVVVLPERGDRQRVLKLLARLLVQAGQDGELEAGDGTNTEAPAA